MYRLTSEQQATVDKARLAGDTRREATSDDFKEVKRENDQLKQLVADCQQVSLPLEATDGRTTAQSGIGACYPGTHE
jgi:hypothetical protein